MIAILRALSQFVWRGLAMLAAFYWIGFISLTLVNLFTGGWKAVVLWYMHISRAPQHWDWRVFLGSQAVILALTVIIIALRPRTDRDLKSGR